jgi:aqualysin 1
MSVRTATSAALTVTAIVASLVTGQPAPGLASSDSQPAPVSQSEADQATPPPTPIQEADDAVPGEYVVALSDQALAPESIAATVAELASDYGADITFTFPEAGGFAARMTRSEAELLNSDPRVANVSENGVIRLASTPWHLDRIDQTDLPLDGAPFTRSTTGIGVDIFIMDTGIRYSHVEFGGRAVAGFDVTGGDGSDCRGHGTRVASAAGGATYGVAPGATLVSVNIFGCDVSTTYARVLAGLDWIAANYSGPSVVNMSFGGGATPYLARRAIDALRDDITFIGAAGNEGLEACGDFPADIPDVLAVGATTTTDAQASFSSWGPCVDLQAPGVGIPTATYDSDSSTGLGTGTSFAAPAVAGAAALFLERAPEAPPSAVRRAILDHATVGRISFISPLVESPNRLLSTSWIAPAASLTIFEDSGTTQDFAFSCSGPVPCNEFVLDDDDAHDATNQHAAVLYPLSPGTYTVTQTSTTSSVSDITCTGGAIANVASREVTVTVVGTEPAVCTFTNSSPTLNVVQDTQGHWENVAFHYDICAASCETLALDDDRGFWKQAPNTATLGGLTPGTYSIVQREHRSCASTYCGQETLDGWTLGRVKCDGALTTTDLASHTVTVTIDEDTHATCTFFNWRYPPPENDEFVDATWLTGGPTAGILGGSTWEPDEPIGGEFAGSVWYRWTPLSAGPATMTLCPDAASTVSLDVLTGASLGSLVAVASTTTASASCTNWHFDGAAGVEHFVRVTDNWDPFVIDDRDFTLTTPPGAEPVSFAVGSTTVREATTGDRTFVVPVTLNNPAVAPLELRYELRADTADAADAVIKTGHLRINTGRTSANVAVKVRADALAETNESLSIVVTSVTAGLTPCNATGTATIVDGTGTTAPEFIVNDVTVYEGDSGLRRAVFVVALTNPASSDTSVAVAPVSGTASLNGDFAAPPRVLTFRAGQTRKTYSVRILPDSIVEGTEDFGVELSEPVRASIIDGSGIGRIAEPGTRVCDDEY